ncbi:MAG: LacI family DNA-binding transcriptional regulator [Bacillota bacterium]
MKLGTRKSITLHDLSKELGLSIQTISKALSGRAGMSEETRSRIIRTAFVRGYLTVSQAREMVSRGIAPYPTFQFRFVLIQSRQSMNYNVLLTEGLRERLDQLDHRLESYVLDEDVPDHAFSDWLEQRNLPTADGLFIAPRLLSDSTERKLFELPLPKVLINYPRPLSRIDSVIWDVFEAVCMAVDRLAQLGHTRIMYVGDIHSQRGYTRRWQAFEEMMGELQLDHDAELHITDVWDESMLIDKLRSSQPTAIIAGIDEDIVRLYDCLTTLGYRIPEDISLVGLANGPVAALPHLSRPQLLIRETGYKAAEKMLWRLANQGEPCEHIRIAGPFHNGQTIRRFS